MSTPLVISGNVMDVDQILQHVGEFGKYQIILEAMLCICMIPQTLQILIMFFAAHNPGWQCVSNSTSCTLNGIFTSAENDNYKFRCNIPRSEWEYTQAKDYSVVTQFDLYCDDEPYAYLTTSMFFIGWGIGAIVLGWVADRYGRLKVLFPSLTLILLTGFFSSFSPNFPLFVTSRFIVGFFTPGVGVQMFVMASEFVGSKFRPLAGIALWLFFALALVQLGVQAIFIRKWKILFIVCTAPYIFVLLFIKFIPESIRWLRLNGGMDKAMEILTKVAKTNGKDILDAKLAPAPPADQGRKANPLDLARPASMLIKSAILSFAWIVNGLVYFGVSLAADDLGGSMYFNYILSSFVEFPAALAAIFGCNKIGRKKIVIIPMFLGSIACIIVSFIPKEPQHMQILRITLGIIGKFCISVSFDSIYTWSVELYPTMIRSQGMGLLQISSRLGAALAPWVAKWLKVIHPVLPFSLMGAITLVSGITLLWLPETKGKATAEGLSDEQPKDEKAVSEKNEDDMMLVSSENEPLENGVKA